MSDADRHPEKAAQEALATLREQGLPPEPALFAVLYAYHLGADPSLHAAIQALRSDGRSLSAQRLHALHRRHVAGLPEVDPAPTLIDAASQLLGLAEDAGLHMQKFEGVMAEAAGRLGVLNGSDLGRFTAALIMLSQRLASEMAGVTSQLDETRRGITELEQQLQETNRAARTDPLTGVCNRRAFDERLAELCLDATDPPVPVALVMLDLDHFKAVNDRWGHAVGDAVLRFVGARLRDAIRVQDVAARYGGEEFALLLSQTPSEEARTIAERVRTSVGTHEFVLRTSGEKIGRVTLSAGVAMREAGEAPEGLLARADAALYAAKHGGRNRTMLAEAPRGGDRRAA